MLLNTAKALKLTLAGLAVVGTLAVVGCAPQAAPEATSDDGAKATLTEAMGDRMGDHMASGTRISNPVVDDFGVTLPEVWIKEDGTLIQRTPTFPTSVGLANKVDGNYANEVEVGESGNLLGWTDPEVSMRYYNADGRGCDSCHENLDDTVTNSLTGSFAHPLINSGLDVDVSVNSCNHCHHVLNETASWIHNIHMVNTDTPVAQCVTCHEISPVDKHWALWDEVKYDLMGGITKVSAEESEADITFTQDKVIPTEELFNVGWNDCAQSEMFNMDTASGKTTPVDEELFNNWEITIYGDGVKQEKTYKLPELIEQAPSVTTQMTSMCIDDYGLGLIGNVEVTGIPLQWLFEQAGLTDDAKAVTTLSIDSDPFEETPAHALNFDDTMIGVDFPDRQILLVYEINGERLSVADGYPVAFWSGADKAARNTKQVTSIRVDTTEQATWTNPMGKNGNYANVGIVGLETGTCIQAGQPFTIEGYAFGFARPLEKIQFSMDNGATWQDLDVSSSTADKWVWWSYTFTPPEGTDTAYVLQVRAVAKDGSVTGFEADGTEVWAPLRIMVNAKSDLEQFRQEVESR
ncbi:molybdopterin-dependent oxidoreductase [uncultured Adlercreutzia sp.]|uniref:molybdopterin-dependent oxidoreductase n=1 Tax=uncultured Adlercreutzia sp. TaxID=875803 RepID=UPI0025FDFA22|nr:molybdopterin-dependent oxidoreductase [uncultured Adlercreutzia sp.]